MTTARALAVLTWCALAVAASADGAAQASEAAPATAAVHVRSLTDADFESVVGKDLPALVEFYAPLRGSAPCLVVACVFTNPNTYACLHMRTHARMPY